MTPSLSIIIPTHNGLPLVLECLASLRNQSLEDFEAIVVDDASSDGSSQAIQGSIPKARLILLRTHSGFASACNQGIQASRGRYVALLNDDATPEPAWAASLVGFLDAHPLTGFCASKVVLHTAPNVVDSCGDFYAREGVAGKIGHLESAERFDRPQEVFAAAASASVYRRELLQEVGGFDEDFFLVHEDIDLSFRARLLGYTCHYVPSAIVRHRVSHTIGYRSPQAEYYASRNQEFVFFKNMPGPLLRKYFALHLMANGLQFASHAARGRAGPWLRGKRDALRDRSKVLAKRKQVQQEARVSPDRIDRILERGWPRDALRRLRASRRAAHRAGAHVP